MKQGQAAKNMVEDLKHAKKSEGGVGPLSERKIPVIENPYDDDEFGIIIKLVDASRSRHPDDDGSYFF